jgi:hypothetical protein
MGACAVRLPPTGKSPPKLCDTARGPDEEQLSTLQLRLRLRPQTVHYTRETICRIHVVVARIFRNIVAKVTRVTHTAAQQERVPLYGLRAPEIAITTSLEQRNTEGAA